MTAPRPEPAPALAALRWERREPPLPAVAVAGLGPAAAALADATRRRLATGTALRAATDGHALVVLGDTADLPWAEGVHYLGWDCGVLVPTTARPWPSPALWRDALTTTAPPPGEPLLTLLPPNTALITPLPTRPADPAALPLPGRPPENGTTAP